MMPTPIFGREFAAARAADLAAGCGPRREGRRVRGRSRGWPGALGARLLAAGRRLVGERAAERVREGVRVR